MESLFLFDWKAFNIWLRQTKAILKWYLGSDWTHVEDVFTAQEMSYNSQSNLGITGNKRSDSSAFCENLQIPISLKIPLCSW